MGLFGLGRVRGVLFACVVGSVVLAFAVAAMASRPGAGRTPVFLSMPARPGFAMSQGEVRASALRTRGATRSALPARVGALLPWLAKADSNTYMGANGHLVTEIFDSPVNYLSSSGWYVPINTALRAGRSGFVQQANDLGVVLPRAADGLVRVASQRGRLAFGLVGASGGGRVSGSVERFSAGSAAVRLSYRSLGFGVGWQARLPASETGRGVGWLVRTGPGLHAVLEGDGVAFKDVRGRTAWVFTAPAAHTATAWFSTRLSLRATGAGIVIGVVPTRLRVRDLWRARGRGLGRWSKTSRRSRLSEGPVTLVGQMAGPGGTYLTDAGDCYLESSQPTTSLCGAATNYVGPSDNTLVRFDVAANLPSHVEVLQAYVAMFLASASTTTAETIGVWQAGKPWTSAATWNTYDGTNAWSTPGGDLSGSNEDDSNVIGASGDVGYTYYWAVEQGSQSWIDGNPPQDDGFIFHATDGASAPNTLGFDTATAPGGYQPHMAVYWQPRLGEYPGVKYDSQQLSDGSTVGVNPANGNLQLSSTDVNLPGVNGLNVHIGRYFNDLSSSQDSFGLGWSMAGGADTYLWVPTDTLSAIDYYDGTGAAQLFSQTSASGPEVAPPGLDAQLTYNGWDTYISSQFTLYFPDTGITETFTAPADTGNKVAQLTSIADKSGDTISYTYNSSGQLTSLTDTNNKTTTFTYSPAGYVSQITDPNSVVYKYVQNSAGQLTSYTGPQGTTSYAYDSYGNLTQITTPDGKVLNVTYDAGSTNEAKAVEQLANAQAQTGPTTTYAYLGGSACSSQTGYDPGWLEGTVTAPDDTTTGYCTNDLGALAATLGGTYTTNYTYDADGRLIGASP